MMPFQIFPTHLVLLYPAIWPPERKGWMLQIWLAFGMNIVRGPSEIIKYFPTW